MLVRGTVGEGGSVARKERFEERFEWMLFDGVNKSSISLGVII